jgi:hypothetical protein
MVHAEEDEPARDEDADVEIQIAGCQLDYYAVAWYEHLQEFLRECSRCLHCSLWS